MIQRNLVSQRLPTDPTKPYRTEADVDADIYLMCRNAMKFNREGDPAWEAARVVGAKWDAERGRMNPGRRGEFGG